MNIPKHWQITELQNLILTKKGKKPEKLSHISFANSVPYLDIEAVEKNIIRKFANSENSVLSNENDLFIVWDGSRSGLISKGKKGVVGSTLMCITSILNKDYLFYFLQSQYENFNKTTTGTSIPHVNSEFFNLLSVPIAPLKEQTEIVSILDEIFEKFETAKKSLTKIPRLLERYRQSVLERAVSGELTEDWREENNVEFDWEGTEIGKIAEIIMGNSPSSDSYNESEIGFPLINGPTEFGKQPWSIVTTENIVRYTTKPSKFCKDNDLLLCVRGSTTGRTNISRIEACIGRGVAAIRSKFQNFINLFFFKSQQKILQDGSLGVTTFPSISYNYIEKLIISLPSPPEQTEIVNRVEKLLKKADEAEAKYNQAMQMIDKLQASVLAMAFRGELSEPQPNDEPVSVLLEKIKTEKARLEQERKELQKKQTQIKKTMAKQEKVVKSIIEVLTNSTNPEPTSEECYRESRQPTRAAFYKDLRKHKELLDIQKSFKKPEGEVTIKLKTQ